ncbi:DOPA 4,5-dioxygenase family protein [Desertibaculum subflavum]|uniref:DOPA 4,5-dioxygenase family protein n=1 Tax=Desertibaculum subflavum TaxID=2268458 RepID=UPI000E667C68
MTTKDIASIQDWHAHVYFDAPSRDAALALRREIEARFEMEMGRFHEKLVGPHPRFSYQVAFKPEIFAAIVPWLALNRGDLVVFIHPNTGDDLGDHRDRAIWLGAKLELDLDVFRPAA